MNRSPWTGAWSGAALTIASAAASAQPVSFTGLGVPPGWIGTRVAGLSADGATVAGTLMENAGGRAFRWTPLAGIEPLALPSGAASSWAAAVSGDGVVVLGGDDSDFPSRLWRWTEAVGYNALHLGGYSWEYITGASGTGEAVGYAYETGQWCPCIWCLPGQTRYRRADYVGFVGGSGGGLHAVGSAGQDATCYGISADGSAVVGWTWARDCNSFISQAVPTIWRGSNQLAIGPAGHFPTAVSQDGSVVAGSLAHPDEGFSYSYYGHAFRWTQGAGVQTLGTLNGSQKSLSKAISGDGSVIVGYSGWYQGGPDKTAFVWDGTRGMRDLRAVLVGLGLNLSGWVLNEAVGISADGRTIAGNGLNPTNQSEAWVAFLGDPVAGPCYANCDGSTAAPVLNVNDFACFLNRFAAGDSYANCDGSTAAPVLNVIDFSCFLNAFAAGCT